MRYTMTALLFGVVACGQAAWAQQENRTGAQDQPTRGRLDAGANAAQGQTPLPGVDREAAISHALCMAIEGNGLWFAAKDAESGTRTGAGAAGANRPGGI